MPPPKSPKTGNLFFIIAVADPIKGLDRREICISTAHLLAQSLDMTVDGPVIHIDLIIVGHIHQLVTAFDKSGALGQRLQQQEFGHGQGYILTFPTDRMAQRIHPQLPALHHLGFWRSADLIRGDRLLPTQERADAFHQKTLGKRFLDVVVRPHTQAQNLVDLIIFRGEEDHRHLGFLAQALQQIHAIHTRHLNIQHRHIRQSFIKGV
mmetsp:Transcript_20415/g.37924  ORF Transcript_20415/g.37924 Transcript_20415/m.37924 type:complete len:208 (+) Transcript_20415:200-823(+)